MAQSRRRLALSICLSLVREKMGAHRHLNSFDHEVMRLRGANCNLSSRKRKRSLEVWITRNSPSIVVKNPVIEQCATRHKYKPTPSAVNANLKSGVKTRKFLRSAVLPSAFIVISVFEALKPPGASIPPCLSCPRDPRKLRRRLLDLECNVVEDGTLEYPLGICNHGWRP
jgi:hypothetical protein